jgi:GNAT superfamily N-acetyltransferase
MTLLACGGPTDDDPCATDPGDDDGDGVCEVLDACLGDDATGDGDGDGVCDDQDRCEGDDALGDADDDGVCDDLDPCEGSGADEDGDGVCDDRDRCLGDDTAGDRDGDGACDDVDPCVQLHAELHGDACEVVFVDPAARGRGDGRTWADAFTVLADAVEAASARGTDRPFEVWLAGGTYRGVPGAPVLEMTDGLVVRGGFPSDAVYAGDRSGSPSIVSGDALGDDAPLDLATVESEREAPARDTRDDDAATVVSMATGTTLDRVEVRDGYRAEVGLGVGVHVPPNSVDVLLQDVRFAGNVGAVRNANGGALGIDEGARVEVRSAVFDGNIAWNGGGIEVSGAAYVVVEDSTFERNAAMSQGAGVYLQDTAGQIDHCSFLGNRIVDNYGSSVVGTRSSGSVSNTLFDTNEGPGAVLLDPDRPWLLVNVTVADHIDGTGQGVVRGGPMTRVVNSVFWNTMAAFVDDAGGQPGEVRHTWASSDLSDWDPSNVWLDATTPATGTPFSPRSDRRHLAHADAGDAYTSACVDLGDTAEADRSFPSWRDFTTRIDGRADGANGDPVDAGAHEPVP